MVAPKGTQTRSTYSIDVASGHYLTAVTNPSGLTRDQVTDIFDNLLLVRETNIDGSVYAETNYTYDVRGNLVQMRDAKGHVTGITYDRLGPKVARQDPDRGHWPEGDDPLGNLIQQRDALGQQLSFEYDALNRLVRKWDSQGIEATDEGPFALGQRTSLVDPYAQVSWQYDQPRPVISTTPTLNVGVG